MEINETILETVRKIEQSQSDMDRDLSKDRQDIQDLKIKIETLIAEMAEMRRAVNLSAERNRDKVAEAVKPIEKATQNLASKIEKSKTVIFGMDDRSWFRKLKDEFKREIKNEPKSKE